MGDRVSIQFVNEGEKSVVLFSHWGGMLFVREAVKYAKELAREVKGNKGFAPLDRLEPRTVMVDFVRHITKEVERVTEDYYFGINENDGDNSDNGHYIIDLKEGVARDKQLDTCIIG